jgi:hypothetical protein
MSERKDETRVTPWHPYGHRGLTHYRIWQRRAEFGLYQRHEWKNEDGSTDVQKWIAAPGTDWLPTAEPVDP